ncbi:hypothetical protein [Hydrogenophaga sp.]|uniref:hypothetical protein n=1 Tax=Hydrogenophaga sp. TaxID=1904254 RepID=UPI00286E7A39|nr:hypothetical protein [Hydrogenophaga sp.]
MKCFFFRYLIQDRRLAPAETASRAVVIVDHHESHARQRLLKMHPTARVVEVVQTPFDAECGPHDLPSRRHG